jgi:tetratricopeptide (TPR) repeat protein
VQLCHAMLISSLPANLWLQYYIAYFYLNTPITFLCRGRENPWHQNGGNLTNNIANTGKTVVTISHNADYFFRMARQAVHAGDHLHALECLDRALETDPHFAGAWHEKGNCFDDLGRGDEALACYDQALKLDPYNAETWYNKGLTLKRIGRETEAYASINRGIDLALGR